MKNTLWRRILLFALVLATVLSVTIPSLAEGYNWFGDHANGSASTGTATGGYSVIFGTAEQCVVGYRFALIKSDGCYVNSVYNNVKDVFFDNYSDYIESRYRGLAVGYGYPFSRSMYYYEDSKDGEDGWERTEVHTAKSTSNAVVESSCGFGTSLPSGNVDYSAKFTEWAANEDNAKAISTLLGSSYATITSNKYTITVEPIFAFSVNYLPVAWTVADIAQWGNVYFGSKVVPSGGDGTFGYIANKTNKDFPNLIYVSDSSVLGSWAWSASALTSKANFYTLSNYAYGTGVLYANGKTPSGGGTTSTSYTITYDANGGTLSGSKTQSYTKTTNVTLQGAPSRSGYTFSGWKPNYNASNSWDSTKKYAAGANCGTGNYGDVTMVAQWTSSSSYTLVYQYDGNGISSATGEGTYSWGNYAQASFTVKPGWRLTEIYGTTYNGGSGTWYESGNTDKAESDRLPKDGPFTYNTKFTMKASRVLTIVTKPYSYGYTVNHYLQNVSGSGYTLAATDTGTADCGSTVTGTVRSYTGFTSPSAQSITIGTSGNVINYYTWNYQICVALRFAHGECQLSGVGRYSCIVRQFVL